MSLEDELDKSEIDPWGMGISLPPGYLTLEDEQLLEKYSEGAGLAVNLGTNQGRSAVILSLFTQKVITVDLVDRLGRGLPGNVQVIIGSSWETAGAAGEGEVDLIFFDADHSFEGILREYEHWLPKLRPEAVVIFHDYKYMGGANPIMAVRPAADHLVKIGAVELVEVAGWCLVGRVRK